MNHRRVVSALLAVVLVLVVSVAHRAAAVAVIGDYTTSNTNFPSGLTLSGCTGNTITIGPSVTISGSGGLTLDQACANSRVILNSSTISVVKLTYSAVNINLTLIVVNTTISGDIAITGGLRTSQVTVSRSTVGVLQLSGDLDGGTSVAVRRSQFTQVYFVSNIVDGGDLTFTDNTLSNLAAPNRIGISAGMVLRGSFTFSRNVVSLAATASAVIDLASTNTIAYTIAGVFSFTDNNVTVTATSTAKVLNVGKLLVVPALTFTGNRISVTATAGSVYGFVTSGLTATTLNVSSNWFTLRAAGASMTARAWSGGGNWNVVYGLFDHNTVVDLNSPAANFLALDYNFPTTFTTTSTNVGSRPTLRVSNNVVNATGAGSSSAMFQMTNGFTGPLRVELLNNNFTMTPTNAATYFVYMGKTDASAILTMTNNRFTHAAPAVTPTCFMYFTQFAGTLSLSAVTFTSTVTTRIFFPLATAFTAATGNIILRCSYLNAALLTSSTVVTAPIVTAGVRTIACGTCDYAMDCRTEATTAVAMINGECKCRCRHYRYQWDGAPLTAQCPGIAGNPYTYTRTQTVTLLPPTTTTTTSTTTTTTTSTTTTTTAATTTTTTDASTTTAATTTTTDPASTTAAPTTTATPTTPAPPNNQVTEPSTLFNINNDQVLSAADIAGIVLGALALLLLVVTIVAMTLCCCPCGMFAPTPHDLGEQRPGNGLKGLYYAGAVATGGKGPLDADGGLGRFEPAPSAQEDLRARVALRGRLQYYQYPDEVLTARTSARTSEPRASRKTPPPAGIVV